MKQYYRFDDWVREEKVKNPEEVWKRYFNKAKYDCTDYYEIKEKFGKYLVDPEKEPLTLTYWWVLVKRKPKRNKKKKKTVEQIEEEVKEELPSEEIQKRNECLKNNEMIMLKNGSHIYVPREHLTAVNTILKKCGVANVNVQDPNSQRIVLAEAAVDQKEAARKLNKINTNTNRLIENVEKRGETIQEDVKQNESKIQSLKSCIENILLALNNESIEKIKVLQSSNNIIPEYKKSLMNEITNNQKISNRLKDCLEKFPETSLTQKCKILMMM